jgi:protein-disulfide isomerase
MHMIDRRVLLRGSAAAALLAACPATAQAQDINLDDLNAPGQLGEKALGNPDAPVTVIEYGSFSCPHCAHFANDIFGQFKLKYIDSGKVRFVFREFLRNGVDVAVSAVARCAPADRYFDVVEAYFANQEEWMRADDLRQAILEEAKPFGFTEESFNACLGNKNLLEALDAEMQRAESFGVTGTPTFFVNGQKEVGALSMEQWDSIIEPMLASAGQ